MGADITFSDGTYYRDSYNGWNLAWVTGKSYWTHKGSHIGFMRAIAKTTDEQIAKYIGKLIREGKINKPSQQDMEVLEMEKHLKEKRDMLAVLFKKDPKVKVIVWSV